MRSVIGVNEIAEPMHILKLKQFFQPQAPRYELRIFDFARAHPVEHIGHLRGLDLKIGLRLAQRLL